MGWIKDMFGIHSPSKLQMDLTKEAINSAILELRERNFEPEPLTFYCGGTGVTDEDAIEFWKTTNVIVVTRDGRRYCAGNLMEDDRK